MFLSPHCAKWCWVQGFLRQSKVWYESYLPTSKKHTKFKIFSKNSSLLGGVAINGWWCVLSRMSHIGQTLALFSLETWSGSALINCISVCNFCPAMSDFWFKTVISVLSVQSQQSAPASSCKCSEETCWSSLSAFPSCWTFLLKYLKLSPPFWSTQCVRLRLPYCLLLFETKIQLKPFVFYQTIEFLTKDLLFGNYELRISFEFSTSVWFFYRVTCLLLNMFSEDWPVAWCWCEAFTPSGFDLASTVQLPRPVVWGLPGWHMRWNAGVEIGCQ